MEQRVKRRLQSMGNYDFEHFIADVWEEMGWDTEVSQAAGDAGIDVIATKETPYKQKKVIQAKRYGDNTTVGGPDVQQYASLRHQVEGADSVVIVTTSSFTSAAKERAEELNVKLVDGEDLVQLVEDLGADHLITKYIPELSQQPSTPEAVDGGNAVQTASTDVRADPANAGDTGRLWKLEQKHDWHRYTAYATGGLIALFLLLGLISGVTFLEPVVGLLGIGWFGLAIFVPLAWYMDMRYVRHHSPWTPTPWMYLLGGLFLPYVALPLYYYRRRKYDSL